MNFEMMTIGFLLFTVVAGACDGDDVDICSTVCESNNGQCNQCYDTPLNLTSAGYAGLTCGVYETFIPRLYPNFAGFCECFTVTNGDDESYDMLLGCGSACGPNSTSSSNSSSDSGACDGDDVDFCQTKCQSNNGQCEQCNDDAPYNLEKMGYGEYAGLECCVYERMAPMIFPSFTGFCECYTLDQDGDKYDMLVGCGSKCGNGSSSGSDSGCAVTSPPTRAPVNSPPTRAPVNSPPTWAPSIDPNSVPVSDTDNTLLIIIGIVVGAVAVVAIVIAITMCKRGDAKKEKVEMTSATI